MRQKTKSRTIKDDKWERKKYIEQSKGVIVKDIIKIRLHMWDLKKNYKKEEEEALCPLCEADGDTTEHVLKYGRDRGNRKQRKERNIKNNTEEEWEQVVQVSRENKKNREQRREKVVKKEAVQFGHLVQSWTVLALNWSAQTQDLCWRNI